MFDWYSTIKAYFDLGLYTAEQVEVFVTAGWISAEQAAEITGEQSAA